MSARREDILNTFWDDEAVDDLSNSAVLLYLWSFTNTRCGMSGVYACKRRAICDGRLPAKTLDRVLAELADARMLFYLDGWLWVRARVKHLSALNPNIARAILRDLRGLPSTHEFRAAFVSEYVNYVSLKTQLAKAEQAPLDEQGLFKPFSQPSRNGSETYRGGGSGS